MTENSPLILPEHLKLIGAIDEFKGSWNAVSNLSPEQLTVLNSTAVIQSVGSSTRIEGSVLSNLEVEALLAGMNLKKLKSRDEQEVAGYADAINWIFTDPLKRRLNEELIFELHRRLLHYTKTPSTGAYKTRGNHVEAFDDEGKSLGVILKTIPPSKTTSYMAALIENFNNETELHPLLTIAHFVVEFLAIHPFDDGNGRLSRILTNLLLYQAGYSYVPYCSLEKIIEDNRDRYYLALNQTQKSLFTGNEDFHIWLSFFLASMYQQVSSLRDQIERNRILSDIPPLSRDLLTIAKTRGRLTISQAVTATQANRNTVKAHITQLVKRGLLLSHGEGKGTWYEAK